MPQKLQPETWYLFELKGLRQFKDRKPTVAVFFVSVEGETAGADLIDTFYLTEKAISRFEVMARRCGFEGHVKTPEDVTDELIKFLTKRRVWARIVEDGQRPGTLKTDGWSFRPFDDPPEEEQSIDYKAQDEFERMVDGL